MEPSTMLPVVSNRYETPSADQNCVEGEKALESLENGDIIATNEREEEEGEEEEEEEEQDQFLQHLMGLLKARVKQGSIKAHFLLGQLYFEKELYAEAVKYFEKVKDRDLQVLYQLGVIYYDGLGMNADAEKGVECLTKVANTKSKTYKHLIHVAQYCLGLAYFQGFGVLQSDLMAEQWWIRAADNGHPKASVKAQSMLGMFYSLPEWKDFQKAFFWHTEACSNGNLESQGALGVMYKFGIGVKQSKESAFICLKEAASRGNVYAMGVLVSHYYDCKMFTNTVFLAKKVTEIPNLQKVAEETDCEIRFIAKGISLAAFFLGRCLDCGTGIKKCIPKAQEYYIKSFQVDPQMYCDLIYQKHNLIK